MRNIRLLIEYDGTRYAGWQRQENGPSIQQEIETALGVITRETVTVTGAGRTDAGVHARGQVANFFTGSGLSCFEMKGSLNGLLPYDIVVLDVDEVPADFHARYSARERWYSYLITRVPSALLRPCTWLCTYPLDLDLMRTASNRLLGTHDFQSFCRTIAEVEHYRCTILAVSWEEEGSLLRFSIGADRFLHGMVRALVGTIIDVGRGRTTLEGFQRIVDARDRAAAGMAAPARGLVLERVVYDV